MIGRSNDHRDRDRWISAGDYKMLSGKLAFIVGALFKPSGCVEEKTTDCCNLQ